MSEIFHVIHSPSLGDTLAATPTTRKLSKSYNRKINVVTHVEEVYKNNPYIENVYSFERFNNLNHKDLQIFETFLGTGTKNQLGVEKKHNTIDIRRFHSFDLGFDLTADEMFYDFIADKDFYLNCNLKYVVLHPSVTWPSRTYSVENWQFLIEALEKLGYFVFLIGKDGFESGFHNIEKRVQKLKLTNGLDLCNKLNLHQTWNLINNAEYVITMDSGILHLAGTTDTFIIQLGSSINHRLRAPYRNGSQEYKYKYISGICELNCASNMSYGVKEWKSIHGVPPLIGCLEQKSNFECHPSPSEVIKFISSKKEKKKYLFIASHLSTGGGPKYLEWLIEKTLKNGHAVKVVEWNIFALDYNVQKNNIINLVGKDNFISVGHFSESNDVFYKKANIVPELIDSFQPDIIHLNDPSEDFGIKYLNDEIKNKLYDPERKFLIVECIHDTKFNMQNKKNIPDEFWFCSDFYLNKCDHINIPKKIVEMQLPVKSRPDRSKTLESLGLNPNKFHVLQVGLFHKNKNQKYIFEIAKQFLNTNIEFHFVGNLCYFDECEIVKQPNCKIWGERSDVDIFMSCMDLFVLPSFDELNPISLKEAISWKMHCFISEIPTLKNKYTNHSQVTFIKDNNLLSYLQEKTISLIENEFIISFIDGPKVEISGNSSYSYDVEFINSKNNEVCYSTTLRNNMWSRCNVERKINWRISIKNKDLNTVYSYDMDLSGKRVKIINESGSLGDCIAWMSAIDSFQKQNNCKVDYYTNRKNLFEKEYSNINFFNYSEKDNSTDYYACYKIGIFFDSISNFYQKDPRLLSLTELPCHILDLQNNEVQPRISFSKNKNKFLNKKYICIATQSTTQSRYWIKENWEALVDYLKSLGYSVICVDKHREFGIKNYMNQIPNNIDYHADTEDFNDIINIINDCEFFIGLTSGLSWLSWALNKKTFIIAGSTAKNYEAKEMIKIQNQYVCNSCFNDTDFIFNASDWLWCPKFKNTGRMFECQKMITVEDVKQKINEKL
jgi:autotransporter strand-loop-strand O-heptosyltransferase